MLLAFSLLIGSSVFQTVCSGQTSVKAEHYVAAIQQDRFHGWPANNGVWQWGDEILVGFTQGDFRLQPGHNIAGRQDTMLARSVDGGMNWKMFDPQNLLDDTNPKFLGEGKTKLSQSLDFRHRDFALRIFAHGYHGNDDPEGGFFYSLNRGQDWLGPHPLTGLSDSPELKDHKFSPRTDYLVQGHPDCLLFISTHTDNEKLKRIACVRTTDGGRTFQFVGWATPHSDLASTIMSQTVQFSAQELVLACRKIYLDKTHHAEIETHRSDDGGKTWQFQSTVKFMRTQSNPPALLRLTDGRLCCVYGDRHTGQMQGRCSNDGGNTWEPEFVIRSDFQAMADDPDSKAGINADIGYPRLVQRTDGKLVAIYYWATSENPQQHIAASVWQP